MKYAVFGDIHANQEALYAVLKDAREQGATHYACVGDIVGYNASPVECLDMIRELGCVTVRGNHDHYCASEDALIGFHPLAADVVNWTRHQLRAEHLEFLRGLKYVTPVQSFTLVHSTLDNPEMWGYVFDKLEAEANFSYQFTAVCFFGHTHVPLAFEKAGDIKYGLYGKIKVALGRKYFINVGSVGQPRDRDPRAAYVLYDVKGGEIVLRRVPYDIETTKRKILEAGLSPALAERLSDGR